MTVYKNSLFAMYSSYSYGPVFGYDFQIYDKCNKFPISFSNLGHTYQPPAGYTYGTAEAKNLLAGSRDFKVDEYEVFFQPGKLASNVLLPICFSSLRQILQEQKRLFSILAVWLVTDSNFYWSAFP